MSEALQDGELTAATHWLHFPQRLGLRDTVRESRSQLRALEENARDNGYDALLLHYSAFTWGWRGIPLLAPMLVGSLRRLRVPVVTFLHEAAFPFGRQGLKGLIWSTTQRAALVPLVRASAAIVVTVDRRAKWLESRVWLPRRRLAVVPVFSVLPKPSPVGGRENRTEEIRLGVLGFGAGPMHIDEVVSAVVTLRDDGLPVVLELVGAPGQDSPHAEPWRLAARAAGAEACLRFTGVKAMADYSSDVASLDVVIAPEVGGPTSRRTTLAGALAYGKPVIALDGPQTWERFRESGAVMLIPPRASELSRALASLVRDGRKRKDLQQRARDFYLSSLSPEQAAAQVKAVLKTAVATRGQTVALCSPAKMPPPGSSASSRVVAISHACVVPDNQSVFRELGNRGWCVEIIVPSRWKHEYGSRRFAATPLGGLEGRLRPLPVLLAGRPQKHLYLRSPSRVLRHLNPDVVYVEDEYFSISALQWAHAARHLGIPFGVQADENLDRPLPFVARWIRSYVLSSAAFVAARSPTAGALAVRFGATGRIRDIPHAVPEWEVSTQAAEPLGIFSVGYAGRFVPEKGIEDLLAATGKLKGRVRLILIGDGVMREQLRAASLPNGDIEVRTGLDHQGMAQAYADVDVLVLPSRTTRTWAEQFGRVLVEALWCGVPVVGSDSGEIPWVIATTGGGLTYQEGNIDALHYCLERLRNDPALRRQLAAAGREAVSHRFSTPAAADALEGALLEVISSSHGDLAPDGQELRGKGPR